MKRTEYEGKCKACAETLRPEECGDAGQSGYCDTCTRAALAYSGAYAAGKEIPGGVAVMLDAIAEHMTDQEKADHAQADLCVVALHAGDFPK